MNLELDGESTQNIGDIVAAVNTDIAVRASIATAVGLIVVCLLGLLVLFVSLTQRQKDFKSRPIRSKLMTNDSIRF